MEFKLFSHRNAIELLENKPEYKYDWDSIKSVIESITEEELIEHFKKNYEGNTKSISSTINKVLKDKLQADGWISESAIFKDPEYKKRTKKDDSWRLDFVKNTVAVEVGFNHGSVVAWNLIKPNLSGELNHVAKNVQTDIGIIVTATDSLKSIGGFDSAIGPYERYLMFLKPLRHMLTVPMLVIGLEGFKTFRIRVEYDKAKGKNVGFVERTTALS